MTKTPAKVQKDQHKTVGGVEHTRYLLLEGGRNHVTAESQILSPLAGHNNLFTIKCNCRFKSSILANIHVHTCTASLSQFLMIPNMYFNQDTISKDTIFWLKYSFLLTCQPAQWSCIAPLRSSFIPSRKGQRSPWIITWRNLVKLEYPMPITKFQDHWLFGFREEDF